MRNYDEEPLVVHTFTDKQLNLEDAANVETGNRTFRIVILISELVLLAVCCYLAHRLLITFLRILSPVWIILLLFAVIKLSIRFLKKSGLFTKPEAETPAQLKPPAEQIEERATFYQRKFKIDRISAGEYMDFPRSYATLHKVVERPDGWLLYTNPNVASFVSKSGFTSGTPEELTELFASKTFLDFS